MWDELLRFMHVVHSRVHIRRAHKPFRVAKMMDKYGCDQKRIYSRLSRNERKINCFLFCFSFPLLIKTWHNENLNHSCGSEHQERQSTTDRPFHSHFINICVLLSFHMPSDKYNKFYWFLIFIWLYLNDIRSLNYFYRIPLLLSLGYRWPANNARSRSTHWKMRAPFNMTPRCQNWNNSHCAHGWDLPITKETTPFSHIQVSHPFEFIEAAILGVVRSAPMHTTVKINQINRSEVANLILPGAGYAAIE